MRTFPKTFLKTLFAVLMTLALGSAAEASDDPMAPLVGTWVSPDGQARQQVDRGFDGSWLTTRQWFRRDGEWMPVGRGAMYTKPGDTRWISATRTVEMGGIALFESTIQPGEEQFLVENRAYMEDGSVLETAEEWRFPSADRIDYVIYRVTDSGRDPWMKGSWVRQQE